MPLPHDSRPPLKDRSVHETSHDTLGLGRRLRELNNESLPMESLWPISPDEPDGGAA